MGPNKRVAGVVATNSCDYVETVFALLHAGAVVVPLRSADDAYRIEAAGVTEIVGPAARHGWLDARYEAAETDEPALIAFTSGTEGQPKGVVLTHANLASTVRRMQEAMRLDSSVREYVGVPVYHSFGFGRCRLIASVGGRAYVPPSGFDLRELCAMLEAGEVNAITAVPSLWRVVLNHRDLVRPVAHKVRWIEIGSQPMSAEEKHELRTLFAHARIVQHYGLTEASRSTFLDVSAAAKEDLGSVGAPNGDVEIRIEDDGRIAIRGAHVAAEVIVDGRRVRNVDEDGWLVTSDLGSRIRGNLEFRGRADDVINCGGLKVSPDQLESEIKRTLGIAGGISVSKVPDVSRGDGVLVAIEAAVAVGDAEIRKAAAAALLGFGVNAESAIKTLHLDKLPTTDSGKVRRRELARLYAERHLGAAHDAGPRPADRAESGLVARLRPLIDATRKPRTVRALFERVFPSRTIHDADTFVGLGGDSLSFVEVSIALEEILGDLPRDWQNRTISELERARAPRALLRDVDTTLLLRFVCIVSIVTGHFTELPIGGATFMLLTVAGYNFSRFQLPNVLSANSVAPVLLSAARIAIPLLLVIAAIEVKHGDFDFASLALLNNWHDATDTDIDFWFVEMLTQVLLFMALLLAIPALRNWIRGNTLLFALVLVVASLGAAMFAPVAWSTTHLYDRVPHMLLWLFALGILVENARTGMIKAAVAALILVTPLLVWNRGDEVPFWIAHGREWVWVGGLLLLYVDKIPVPYPVNKLAYWIGGASMFIYILHWSVRGAWQGIAPVQSVFLEISVAILAGVAAWWIWDFGTRMLVRLYANWRDAGLSRASSSSQGGGVTFPPTSP